MQMNEMLHQENILYHLEQAFYGGYTSRELRLGIVKCVNGPCPLCMISNTQKNLSQAKCPILWTPPYNIWRISYTVYESCYVTNIFLLIILSWFNWRFILSFFSFGLLAPMLLKGDEDQVHPSWTGFDTFNLDLRKTLPSLYEKAPVNFEQNAYYRICSTIT